MGNANSLVIAGLTVWFAAAIPACTGETITTYGREFHLSRARPYDRRLGYELVEVTPEGKVVLRHRPTQKEFTVRDGFGLQVLSADAEKQSAKLLTSWCEHSSGCAAILPLSAEPPDGSDAAGDSEGREE